MSTSSVTPAPTLTPPGLRLRQVAEDDVARLTSILAEPAVAAWWPAYDEDRVRADLLLDDEESSWVIEIPRDGDWRVAGYIQSWEDRQPEFMHANIDLFITSDEHGRGLGPRAIHAIATWLVDVRGHHRLTIDPAADNERAIRAYAKVGFAPVGRMRAYQRMPDGSWIDGLLMEQLADDLRLELSLPALIAMIADARDASAHPIVVALDGRSGSGKSTMASALADALDAAVVTGDDFYADLSDDDRRSLSPGAAAESMFDWRRLRDEALIPLRQRRVASYRPYDWSSGAGLGADAMTIAPADVVVLDGVYSGRPELADFVDVAVVVHCPRPERLQRLAARAHGNEAWHEVWEAAEYHYFTGADRLAAYNATILTGI